MRKEERLLVFCINRCITDCVILRRIISNNDAACRNSVLHDSVLGRSQRSRMTLPSESTRVNIVAGVHFQVISAGNTPEIVTICGMVDTLSIDACQISNPLLKHFIKSR